MDSTASPNDEGLAQQAAAGSRDAFEALVSRFGGGVLAVVEKQVGDHHLANDLSQEIWVKVFRALPRYQPDGSFRSWLYSIALNHVRDAQRKKARSKVVYLDDYRSHPAAPRHFDPRGQIEERAAIDEALSRVPEPFRSAVTLVDVLDLSYEEAARSLSCRIGTVKSRVSRGRIAFRDEYQKLDGNQRDGRQRDGRQRDGRQRDGRQRDGRQRDGRQRDGRQRDGRQAARPTADDDAPDARDRRHEL